LGVVVILTLFTAHGLSTVPPQFAGPVDDFDDADFPGLIILHVHTDGEVHVHIHVLGSHFFFLGVSSALVHPSGHTAMPVDLSGAPGDALLPLLFNVGNEPLAGALPLLLGLTILLLLVFRLLKSSDGGRLRISPPDPPPRPRNFVVTG
jgi:hypothetical protein